MYSYSTVLILRSTPTPLYSYYALHHPGSDKDLQAKPTPKAATARENSGSNGSSVAAGVAVGSTGRRKKSGAGDVDFGVAASAFGGE
jgi:hypothetical protein